MALNEFRKKMKKVREARQASRDIYDPKADPGRRAGAYGLAEVLAREIGRKDFDPTNPEIVNQILAVGTGRREETAYGYFEADLERITSDENAREGLAENVFAIRPIKTGNSTHDARVEAHARLLTLKNLERAYKDNELSSEELAAKLEVYVINLVDEALSNKRDSDNEYLSDRFKDNAKALAVSSLRKRRGSAEAYLADAIAQSNMVLNARLPDEESRVAYAKENIRAYAAKGYAERAYAANILDEITQKKEQETLDRDGEIEEDRDVSPVIARDEDDGALDGAVLADIRPSADLGYENIAA